MARIYDKNGKVVGTTESKDIRLNDSNALYEGDTLDEVLVELADIPSRIDEVEADIEGIREDINNIDFDIDLTDLEVTNSISLGRSEGTTVGKGSVATGYSTKATSDYSHAEGYGTTASGEYSHAEGIYATASGAFGSHAEGFNTEAKGQGSHAEGRYTIASSDYQHVQGQFNIADTTNTYAHIVGNGEGTTTRSNAHTLDWNGNGWYQGGLSAEKYLTIGSNTVVGDKSVAMGYGNTVNSQCSFAVGTGNTVDNGSIFVTPSFAIGDSNTVTGDYSIAIGECTTASSRCQTVIGRKNIADTEDKYIFIVGNDSRLGNGRNAHTLDWSGNAWFSGNVTVGADNKELATKEYVDDNSAPYLVINPRIGEINGNRITQEEWDKLISGDISIVKSSRTFYNVSVAYRPFGDNDFAGHIILSDTYMIGDILHNSTLTITPDLNVTVEYEKQYDLSSLRI